MMDGKVLPQAFYSRDTVTVARELIGQLLVSRIDRKLTRGRIVETEAYLPKNDPACHASQHRTPRTEVMFGAAGVAYVYPIHARYCFNVVTETPEKGCAVLIRSLEPMQGMSWMQQRRGVDALRRLTTGPACLCESLGILRRENGWDLTAGRRLWIEQSSQENLEISVSPRIGVTQGQELPLRFYERGNRFVSGPLRLRR